MLTNETRVKSSTGDAKGFSFGRADCLATAHRLLMATDHQEMSERVATQLLNMANAWTALGAAVGDQTISYTAPATVATWSQGRK